MDLKLNINYFLIFFTVFIDCRYAYGTRFVESGLSFPSVGSGDLIHIIRLGSKEPLAAGSPYQSSMYLNASFRHI